MDYIVEKADPARGGEDKRPSSRRGPGGERQRSTGGRKRIALQASKQCGRTKPAGTENTLEFKKALLLKDENGLTIILHVSSSASIKEFLRNTLQGVKNIIVLI